MSSIRTHRHFFLYFVPLWVAVTLLILMIPSPSTEQSLPSHQSGVFIQQIPRFYPPPRVIKVERDRLMHILDTVRAY